ncbi:MAG TPA: UBP-type zinc finger domain-containing protein [Gaiellales bacterium]|nr:UBP-type zinc finger domain-containing protein [Gaiellales bacterium]
MADACTHLAQIEITQLPDSIPGCEDCLKIGDRWLHLRMCTTCGHIACCDSSPNRHATAHARAESHPVIRSAEPGEDWFWCYEDEVAFTVGADS